MSGTHEEALAELQRANGALRQERDTAVARQAASIDVLKTISASPDDPQPVFEMIARHARELCNAAQVSVTEYDGALMHLRALNGFDPAAAEILHRAYPRPADPHTIQGQIARNGQIIHIRDHNVYQRELGAVSSLAQSLYDMTRDQGVKSLLGVPLLRDGRVIGSFLLRRMELGGFDDSEIALVQSFAEQAVIAISSATALRELRARTEELAARNTAFAEQIDHQAATIDVLQAMSASPGDPQPVFDLIAERARAVCNADFSAVTVVDAGMLRLVAHAGAGDYARQIVMAFPSPIGAATTQGRAVLGRAPVRIADTAGDPDYAPHDLIETMRATAAVPVLRDGVAIGAIGLADRCEVVSHN